MRTLSPRITGVTLMALALYLALMVGAGAHDHWQWIADHPTGSYCCTDDCRALKPGEATFRNGSYYVKGQRIPWKDVHQTPPDILRPWSCFPTYQMGKPLCIFLPIPKA